MSGHKRKSSLFSRINNWLHLWLGLASGLIVFVVCITGCIWVFNEEITSLLHPETKVEWQDKPVLKPSELIAIGARHYPNQSPAYVNYLQGRTIDLSLKPENAGTRSRKSDNTILKVHPYTGVVVGVEDKGGKGFFPFILEGHRFLWMPSEIGRPIVNYGTLVFVIMLITGLIWWYPKKWSKNSAKRSFKVKWGASFKRLNLDLHNVLGFYALLFLAAIALTGMVYGLQWYSSGLYWVTSGGNEMRAYESFRSDSVQRGKYHQANQAMDRAFEKVVSKHPQSTGFYYQFLDTTNSAAVIDIAVFPNKGQFYNTIGYTFDQHSLKEFMRKDYYSIPFTEASFAQKLRKMNYDIHIGTILGFPGKVLAFLASLIGASLPITGFLIWYGRKFKKKNPKYNGKSLMRSIDQHNGLKSTTLS